MVMTPLIKVTPEVFGDLLSTAMIWAKPKIRTDADLAQRLRSIGYSETVTGQTVGRWRSGERKEIPLHLIRACALATGQSEAYFLGMEPVNYNPESHVNFSLRDLPIGDTQVTVQDFESILNGDWLGIQESNLCLTIQSRQSLNVTDLLYL